MNLDKLEIKNFRNLKDIKINLSKEINLLIGNNGQGKTNLLESIFYLSTTKTIRTTNSNNLIRDNELFCKIKTQVLIEKRVDLEIIINKEGKILSINNNKINKSSEFIGKINAVLFYPGETEIFDSYPQKRRRLIDIELSKFSNKYLNNISLYNNLLKERNKLLKEEKINYKLIETISDQMINYQKFVLLQRNDFINKINSYINLYFYKFTKNEKKIVIQYQTILKNVEEYDNNIKKIYQDSLKKDIFIKNTNIGIHKDDYLFYIDDKLVMNYASQGQKRIILLSFKLALVNYIYDLTNEYPILLLDDVMSELDKNNQKVLFEIIPKELQTIITTTHLDIDNKNINIIEIKNGMIMEEK